MVFDGEGILDVRKVGLQTMMGKMAEEMQEEEPDSPLKVKLAKLAKQISTFGYIGAIVIAVLYFAYFIVSAGGPSVYFAAGAEQIIKDVVEASILSSRYHRLCSAGGTSSDDLPGSDAEHQQDVRPQRVGA